MKVRFYCVMFAALFSASCLAVAQQPSGASSLDAQLLAAAKSGDTATLQSLLRQGANIEAINRQEYSETPLIEAASQDQTDTVTLLLSHGANIEAKGQYGYNALMESAERGYTNVVKILVDKHANIEARSESGDNALGLAALGGHTDTVKLLLDSGAKVDAEGENNRTALIEASTWRSNFETAKLLVDRNAKIDCKDKFGRSALFYAAANGKLSIVTLLLDHGADATAHASDGMSILDWSGTCSTETVALLRSKGAMYTAGGNRDRQLVLAAESGQVDLVKQFLDQGANPNGVAADGDTPLSAAAACGQRDTAALLLAHGANVDGQDRNKNTPLIKAATAGQTEVVLLLLKKHAAIDFKGEWEATPLIAAATAPGDHTATIKLLVQKGANIEMKGDGGSTALISAASSGNLENVAQLLDQHANIEARDDYGNSSLDDAAKFGHVDVVKLLLDRGAKLENPSHGGALYQTLSWLGSGLSDQQKLDMVRLLLDRGANVNSTDKDGDTVLMAAGGQPAIVQLLLDRGANVNAADKDGDTALTNAAGSGHSEVISLLLDKGADLQARDRWGRPALNEAAQSGYGDVVSILLQRGANIETRDKCDSTPLLDAVWAERTAVVKLLLEKGADIQAKATSHNCSPNNVSALDLACGNGSVEIAQLLMDKGATIDAGALVAPIGSNAKWGMTDAQRLAIIKFLLGRNPDTELKNQALLTAASGFPEIVTLLLNNDANINAQDAYGRTALMIAVQNYGGDYVQNSVKQASLVIATVLLDHGAGLDLRNHDGDTALMLAVKNNAYHYNDTARQADLDMAKLLLDRGADPSAIDNDGKTALVLATPNDFQMDKCTATCRNMIAVLQNAHRGPRQEFEEQIAQLSPTDPSHWNNNDLAVLDKVIAFASQANPAPAPPESARSAFVEATTFMKNGQLQDAEEKFENAIKLAPWWADAYYNCALADEKLGRYDDASKLLELYLKFPLSEQDSRDAHDRIYALAAEKESHKKAQEQFLQEAAVKYVSGGAQRVDESNTPEAWRPKGLCGTECMYGYRQNRIYIDHYYQNMFRMPSGHYLGVILEATASSMGEYSGDKILVVDIVGQERRVGEYAFGALNEEFNSGTGGAYKISISERSTDGVVSITDSQSGAAVTMPLADLYLARYINACCGTWDFDRLGYVTVGNTGYEIAGQGGLTSATMMFFNSKLDAAHADPMSLLPSYVLALDQKDHPIGNTGYFMRWNGTSYQVAK